MEPSVVLEGDSPASAEPCARGGERVIKTRIKCGIDACRGVLIYGALGQYDKMIRDEIMGKLMKGCGGACENLVSPSLITETC